MSDKTPQTETPADAAAQEAPAHKAMEMKQDATTPAHPSSGRTADKGMPDNPNEDIAPSGAFGAEGQRPVLERSNKVR